MSKRPHPSIRGISSLQRTIDGDGCITLRSSSSSYRWGVLPSNLSIPSLSFEPLHHQSRRFNFSLRPLHLKHLPASLSLLLRENNIYFSEQEDETVRSVGQVRSIDAGGRWPRLINPHQESKGRTTRWRERERERERHLEIVGGKWPSERASLQIGR